MPIAAFFVNKSDPETRERYDAVFRQLDRLGARHPDGRLIPYGGSAVKRFVG